MIIDEKSKYKSWSYLKKQMNGLLCDSLKGKITYCCTRYHRVHNAYGRATVNYGKEETAAFSWVETYKQEYDMCKEINDGNDVSYDEMMKEKWMTNCTLGETNFIDSVTVYLKTDIAGSIHSDNYLLRVFAYLEEEQEKE